VRRIGKHDRVMAGLVPAIDTFYAASKGVDARREAGHDEREVASRAKAVLGTRAGRRQFRTVPGVFKAR
jgi:hypothetical protein